MSHAPSKRGNGRVGSVVLSERHGFLGRENPTSVRSASRRLRKNNAQEAGPFPGRLRLIYDQYGPSTEPRGGFFMEYFPSVQASAWRWI